MVRPSHYLQEAHSDKILKHKMGNLYDQVFMGLLDATKGKPLSVLEIGAGTSRVGSNHHQRSGLVFSSLPYVDKFVTVDVGKPSDLSDREIFIEGNAYTDEVVQQVSEHAPFHLLIDDGSHHLEDQVFFFKHYSQLRDTPSVMICEDIPEFHWKLLASKVLQTYCPKTDSYLQPELRCTNLWSLDSYQLVLYSYE